MFGFKKNKSTYDYMIVGLGNPGLKYENTKHNIGFMCLDKIAEKNNTIINKMKQKAYIADVRINDNRCLLVKPQTFMNLSGEAVVPLMKFYKIEPENVIIIFDDVSFDVGKIRIKRNGSHGGHNGMRNIIELSGTDAFPRVKVGVGKKPHPEYDLADWVLSKFKNEDFETLDKTIDRVAKAIDCIIKNGIDTAMNRYSK